MKPMFAILFATACLSAATARAAALSIDQLWAQDAQEHQWLMVPVTTPGLSGDIKAYQTNNGEFKLESIGDQIQAYSEIESNQFSRYKNQDQFLKSCNATIKAYPAYRRLALPYIFKMQVFPPRNQNLGLSVQTAAGTQALTTLATSFSPLTTFEVHIKASPDANLFKTGDLDLGLLERQLLTQVLAQKDSITQTGQIALNLDGDEDVICDLIAGRAKIGVQIYMNYSRAKLEHETRLTNDQMNDIYAQINDVWTSNSSPVSNERRGARLLYRAVEGLNLATPLSDDEYDRLQNLLFDPQQGGLRCLVSDQITATAAQMDTLKEGMTLSYPTFTSVVHSPFATTGESQ